MSTNSFTCDFTVPENMIDELGHVHYLNYRVMAEMAHKAFLAEHGLQIEEVTKMGSALFMRTDSCVYKRTLKEGDVVRISLICKPETIATILFNVTISIGDDVAAEITYIMTVVHYPSGRPKRLDQSPFKVLFETK